MSDDEAEKSRLRMLAQRNEAIGLMRDGGIDEDVVKQFESSHAAWDTIGFMIAALAKNADESAAKNYIALNIEGIRAPFDRVNVELVRKGGRPASDVVDDVKGALNIALMMLREAAVRLTSPDSGGDNAKFAASVLAYNKRIMKRVYGLEVDDLGNALTKEPPPP